MERFWSKVARGGPDECWPWQAGRFPAGYGAFQVDNRPQRAHRVSFWLTHGRWPEPCCLHRCDNPSCCNPAHLFEGTNAENQADKVAKGRQAAGDRHGARKIPGLRRGERNGRAILTPKAVRAIRACPAGTNRAQLAKRYGVAVGTIDAVLTRRLWPHLE